MDARAAALPILLAAAAAAPPTASRPATVEVAPGVTLLPGRFVAGAQPDGNTVLFSAPGGLVVIDTGRHATHADEILAFARRAGAPIAAVVNTHWHLDHVGGNPKLRAAYPALRVHASRAIEAARTGFLAAYRRQLADVIAGATDPAERKAWETELALVDAAPALGPDEPIVAPGSRTLGGKAFQLGLAARAVTEADVWVLDPATGVLAAGDLVTLPVPFLDTACAPGWQAALATLAAAPFRVLVPGHGPPMTRAQLEAYRAGFDRLLACAASDRADDACVAGWLHDLGALVPAEEYAFAETLLRYYLANVLRAPAERRDRYCAPRE